ncbi:auxiliary transport protein, MFP family [Klebsiella pneumoniae]|uniref:Auxiliary transport protein, MFP family n=1 Tax=Klebsiella pneumoniae TaxID=573 RepID=A0A447S261_KLEPN|nr:auxiliary transport protein, MFP family [Klebsiella pneumoniae]
MSTALGMIPLMTFVPVEGRRLAGVRRGISPERPAASAPKGEPAELMFPAIPGTVFRGEVADVLPAIGESQFQGQGKLLTTDALNTHGRALVVLKVTDPRFAEYALPQGATLEAAVYSDHLKELSLIRKILIRMKSWENYIYLDH